jgi:hypothetical protein
MFLAYTGFGKRKENVLFDDPELLATTVTLSLPDKLNSQVELEITKLILDTGKVPGSTMVAFEVTTYVVVLESAMAEGVTFAAPKDGKLLAASSGNKLVAFVVAPITLAVGFNQVPSEENNLGRK